MNARKLLDWRKVLIYTHRWLGIGFGLLFLVWFLSGIAFMYWGMPSLGQEERLARQAPVDLRSVTLSPIEAARRNFVPPSSLSIRMRGARPVYVMAGAEVYADTGEYVEIDPVGAEAAVGIVREWVPDHAATVRYDVLLTDSDQWTLQSSERQQMPLHRIGVGDPDDTYYYVAADTGRLVMKTDRVSRIQGFLSGVLHWVYFTPIRRNGYAWNQFIIWGSFAGGLMCLLGLAVGVWRVSPRGRYRQKRHPSHSPYSGLMRWHHYAGLLFGAVTFTWVLSGAFSVNPFGMFSERTGLTREDRSVVAGGAFDIESLTVDQIRAGLSAIGGHFEPKQVDVRQFRGRLYMAADAPPDGGERDNSDEDFQMVWLDDPEAGTFVSFGRRAIDSIADELMPGVPVGGRVWLEEYDNYYRSRDGSRPLPVLRVQYLDDARTWVYLDPGRGSVSALGHGGRMNRWLYAALHEFDFPLLYERRPLWDVVVILLSVGGTVLAGSSLWPGVRRIYRNGRRLIAWRPFRPRSPR